MSDEDWDTCDSCGTDVPPGEACENGCDGDGDDE